MLGERSAQPRSAGQHGRAVLAAPEDGAGHRVEPVGVVVLGVGQNLVVVEQGLSVDRAVDRGVEQLAEGAAGHQARGEGGLVGIPAGAEVVGPPGSAVDR